MIDPALFASVPYGSKTALVDFAGTLELYFRALAQQAATVAPGLTFRLYPLGDPNQQEQWLDAIQSQYRAIAEVLQIEGPPDLTSFDLDEPEDHASFFFIIAQETRILRNAVGLS